MYFSLRTKLFRNGLTRTLALISALGTTTLNAVADPILNVTSNSKTSRSEYEEWGLEPPKPRQNTKPNTKPETKPRKKEGLDNLIDKAEKELEAEKSSASGLPGDLTASVEKSTVFVYSIQSNGKKYRTSGWIIDAQRGIILTQYHMLEGAETLAVAFPQIKGLPVGEMQASVAKLLHFDAKTDVAFLHAVHMPEYPLSSLMGRQPVDAERPVAQHPGAPQQDNQSTKRPAPTSPTPPKQQQLPHSDVEPNAQESTQLAGRWVLQHQGNGAQLYIEASFSEHGLYSMQIITVDARGNRNQEFEQGKYSIQNTTLILNTSDGALHLPFWFQDGKLLINYPELNTTFWFNKA
ncbi:MAG TPA: hypothetical protein VNQ76_16150 [Planctomicrobium sp.]|nr:hypothetical protein [Planctomicrobium sp.]